MRKPRFIRRETGLRGRAKRIFAAVVAIILSLMLGSVALADNGNGGQPAGGQRTEQPKSDTNGSGRSNNGKGNANGKHSAEMEGINTDKIEEAIASLTDTDAQASLTELLTAYETAWNARQTAIAENSTDDLSALTSAVTAAKDALDAALDAAGVDTDSIYGVPEDANDGTGRMNSSRPALDTDEIETLIVSLEDTDTNKATLTSLLAAYETAFAAEQNADASLTNEEYKALSDATKAAEKALLEAAKAAGVIDGQGRGQFVNGYAYGNTVMNTTEIAAQIAGLSDTDENKATLQELLAAYQAALEAEQNTDASSLTEEEAAALSDATKAAADALKEALENAGLDTQVQNQQRETKEYEFNVLPDGSDSTSKSSQSVVDSFLKWLGSLFK